MKISLKDFIGIYYLGKDGNFIIASISWSNNGSRENTFVNTFINEFENVKYCLKDNKLDIQIIEEDGQITYASQHPSKAVVNFDGSELHQKLWNDLYSSEKALKEVPQIQHPTQEINSTTPTETTNTNNTANDTANTTTTNTAPLEQSTQKMLTDIVDALNYDSDQVVSVSYKLNSEVEETSTSSNTNPTDIALPQMEVNPTNKTEPTEPTILAEPVEISQVFNAPLYYERQNWNFQVENINIDLNLNKLSINIKL